MATIEVVLQRTIAVVIILIVIEKEGLETRLQNCIQ
jgi:hypothetical protein